MLYYEIKSRWTGNVIFTAEIECEADASDGFKLGLAVKLALKSDANLSDANLSDANLSDANLRDAYLRDANLRDANLSDANLSDANLSGANLSGANLSGANLRDANLSGANLRGANLSDANLSDANLSDANLSDANLSGANLRYAKDIPDWRMPDGLMFSAYLRDVVPALLRAGGKTVREIVAAGAWDCHSWDNCPMAHAFSVHDLSSVPPLLRSRAEEFVRFFDSLLIPLSAIEPAIEPAPEAATAAE